jgi:hypothetical protein
VFVQVSSGYIRLGQVSQVISGYMKFGQVRSYYITLGHVKAS